AVSESCDCCSLCKMALDQYLSVPLLITAVTFFITYWIVQLWNKNRKIPPGPWGLPFLGYYPFIPSDEPFKHLTELSEKYGKIYSFRTLGGRLVIVLNGTKMVKDVIVNRAEEFIGRPHGDTTLTWISEVGLYRFITSCLLRNLFCLQSAVLMLLHLNFSLAGPVTAIEWEK
ncbi:hypothetical protein AVEN_34188-1, partial [Araneus ventricosus]